AVRAVARVAADRLAVGSHLSFEDRRAGALDPQVDRDRRGVSRRSSDSGEQEEDPEGPQAVSLHDEPYPFPRGISVACGRRQVSWLTGLPVAAPSLGSGGFLVAMCGWRIRLQWRVRAGFSPDFP